MDRKPENRLDCSAFEDRIHQLLDDRLTLAGDRELMEHAAQCPPCNETLKDYQSVDDSIRLLHDDIELAIAERLATRSTNNQRQIKIGNWLVALAAGLLILVGMFPKSDRTSPNQPISVRKQKSYATSTHLLAVDRPALSSNPVKPERKRAKRTSPFHPDFSIANQLQHIPAVPSWQQVTEQLEGIEPVVQYSSELPGLATAKKSLSYTLGLIKQTFAKPDKSKSDLDLSAQLPWIWLAS